MLNNFDSELKNTYLYVLNFETIKTINEHLSKEFVRGHRRMAKLKFDVECLNRTNPN